MATETVRTSIEAARWVSKFYKSRSHTFRQISAVAGKVTAQPETSQPEVIAAWVYRSCEDQVRDNTDQECLLLEIEEICGTDVYRIVRSLVVPFKSNEAQTRQQFIKSCDSAKRIRIAEVIVGLEASFLVMYSGSMAKVDDVRQILTFAKFVYENSKTIQKEIRNELASLIVGVENMWNAIMSTMESFERTIGSPDMVPVKLIAVANDLGSVKIATFDGDPEQVRVRAAFDALRKEVGGSLFTETLLHATVPLPKIDVIKPVPVPPLHATVGHDELDCNCSDCHDLRK
jgi:hypothetical protein